MVPQSALKDSVLISHIDYAIVRVPASHWNGDTFGQCKSDPPTIELRDDLSEWRLKEVLIHEIMHGIMFEFDVPAAFKLNPEDIEESIVSRLAQGWTLVYRDNPWLAKFLS